MPLIFFFFVLFCVVAGIDEIQCMRILKISTSYDVSFFGYSDLSFGVFGTKNAP